MYLLSHFFVCQLSYFWHLFRCCWFDYLFSSEILLYSCQKHKTTFVWFCFSVLYSFPQISVPQIPLLNDESDKVSLEETLSSLFMFLRNISDYFKAFFTFQSESCNQPANLYENFWWKFDWNCIRTICQIAENWHLNVKFSNP